MSFLFLYKTTEYRLQLSDISFYVFSCFRGDVEYKL